MIKIYISLFIISILTGCSKVSHPQLTKAQAEENMALLTNINYGAKLAWRAAVIQKMLQEANWAAVRLKLPTKRPIEIMDIQDEFIGSPWFRVIYNTNGFPDTIFGTHVFDSNIPREQRLRALKIGIGGRIDTANFEFGFNQGRLVHILRLSEPNVEYYAGNLDGLIGKPSLVDTNSAYQLATQWLSAVEVDVDALEKQAGPSIKGGHVVNQLHYLARGTTNYVLLPLYYVDFGSQHFPAHDNLKAFDEPLTSVEILGTTKELQELTIGGNTMMDNISYDHRPRLLITNALELVRTPNPSVKELQNPATMRVFILTPRQVSNYSRYFQASSNALNQFPKTNSP